MIAAAITKLAMGILSGVTVLDFTQFLSGPTCTMILSDMGATVIKIERPNKELSAGPYLGGERTYDLSVMRGKKSVTFNMKDENQKAMFLELAKTADIVVENFKPGTMAKMGIPYEEICKVNPNVVFTSVSGYGQYGPFSRKAALDLVIQAAGGIMSVTGETDRPPLKIGISASDLFTGLYALTGTLANLYHKIDTGEGQHLDMAMMDSMMPCMDEAIISYCATGEVMPRIGNMGRVTAPDDLFPTADGSLAITAADDGQWRALCGVLKCDKLLDDGRFADAEQRRVHAAECSAAIGAATVKFGTAELLGLLMDAGVPCSTVRTIDQVVQDEQILSRGMITEVEHPTAGKYRLPDSPLKYSKTPNKVQCAAPVLGADTRVILKSIGYSDADVDKLLDEQKPLRKMFVDYPI